MRMSISVLVSAIVATATLRAASADDPAETLSLIRQWITPGYYDNQSQVAKDLELGLPDNLQHTAMFQLFVPVEMPNLEGAIYFQQSYLAADLATVIRAGLTQFVPDAEANAVRLRELHFEIEEDHYDAYKTPDVLAPLTLADLWWDEGCDFFLTTNEDKSEIRGIITQGACRLDSDMFDMELMAQDEVVIRPGEFWFWGRYVDAEGNVMWGTESDELNRLVFTGRTP